MNLRFSLLLLLLAGCVSVPRAPQAADGAAPFPVAGFFTGRSEGQGVLRVMMQDARPVRVRSQGRVARNGEIVLSQHIEEEGKSARQREWRLRETAPGRFTGSLTEATGPVRGEVRGGRLLVSYRMRGGLDVSQTLTMLPGGRSVRNVLVVRKLGMPVAALEETIIKVGP
jgi:hypothetical protein